MMITNGAHTGNGASRPVGLYIHIPFCVKKCNYCDFCSKAPVSSDFDRYFDRLSDELSVYRRTPKISVDTVFIGGGTPSLLPVGYFTRLFKTVHEVFDIKADAEITTEINPGTLTRQKALEYRSVGINRASLGLQSIHENELKSLGRIHSFDDFLSAYGILRDVGFDNISVDLMYGIPEQTQKSLEKTLDTVIGLAPEHISLYGLIIEEDTPFGRTWQSLQIPTEDEECDMYYLACDRLGRAGYSHYEISNYHRDGHACRHNLKYWNTDEYIGIGAAAHSFFEGKRFGNTRDLFDIIRDPNADDESGADEYVMMRLRLSAGLSLSEYRERFGTDFLSDRGEKLSILRSCGLVELDGERLYLTERGFYVSNSIITELI